ncbi:MAG: hypothetical protein AABY53_06690 [Bdellovibrionota bacterium]
MSHENLQMLIEIKTQNSAILKPHEMRFWDLKSNDNPKHLHNLVPSSPFKFYTDAILALCYHKMTDYKFSTAEQKSFSSTAYRTFDPYTEIFHKSAPRVKSLRSKDLTQNLHFENFEKKMTEAWSQAFSKNAISFPKLVAALDCISEFEHFISAPLIYNFSIQFSEKFTEKLICFYSLLFHLRSIVAVDHNAHVEDSSYESVKCDSISDYLPKSEYIINDALLYWHFKKLSVPFVGHKDKDVRLEKLFIEPMHKHFKQYSHNACNLIDQLPPSFLNSLNHTELEEALHHVQMDWLLGSEGGLLFKIREELFGVLDGYDKIFWPECSNLKPKQASTLNLCFELSEKDLSKSFSAA